MARERLKNPQVTCTNCSSKMTRYRRSSTGLYYCREADCQAARRAAWLTDRVSPEVRELRDQIAQMGIDAAAFINAARTGAATCPECGFTNAPLGWAHPTAENAACSGLGNYAGSVQGPIVYAVWPESDRAYVDVK